MFVKELFLAALIVLPVAAWLIEEHRARTKAYKTGTPVDARWDA